MLSHIQTYSFAMISSIRWGWKIGVDIWNRNDQIKMFIGGDILMHSPGPIPHIHRISWAYMNISDEI